MLLIIWVLAIIAYFVVGSVITAGIMRLMKCTEKDVTLGIFPMIISWPLILAILIVALAYILIGVIAGCVCVYIRCIFRLTMKHVLRRP